MPAKSTDRGAYFLCNVTKLGKYRLLIGHSVPRNTTTTTLAWRPSRARDQLRPSLLRGNVQSARRTPSGAESGLSAPARRVEPSPQIDIATVTITGPIQFRRMSFSCSIRKEVSYTNGQHASTGADKSRGCPCHRRTGNF